MSADLQPLPRRPFQFPFSAPRFFIATKTQVVYNQLLVPVPCLSAPNNSFGKHTPVRSLLSLFENMFMKPALLISIAQAALLLSSAEARIWLLERDGRAVYARRFGQEQPTVLKEIAAACGGGVCDTLAGEAVSHCHLLTSFYSPPTRGAAVAFRDLQMTDVWFGFGCLGHPLISYPARVFAAGHGR